jgi:hypothetical protein
MRYFNLATKWLLLSALVFFGVSAVQAQKAVNIASKLGIPTDPKIDKTKELSFGERLYFGGDFGLSLGRTQTFINLSPLVGYKLNEKLSIGAGPVFQYWQDQVVYINEQTGFQYQKKVSSLIYGGKGFGRLFLFKDFFANVEFEYISADLPIQEGLTERRWIPAIWAGAGYMIKLNKNAGINIMALYNPLFDKQNSPYTSPFDVRVGFVF